MNSHTQIQNTLNNPPLQPYLPNLNQSAEWIDLDSVNRVVVVGYLACFE